jgi:hypothetical protein
MSEHVRLHVDHRLWLISPPPPKFTGRIGGGAKLGAGAPASPSP